MTETAAHKQKLDFLLEKGMEILWACGYNATSVNDIVKAADVPKGSFYFYFESKEDFVVQALEKYFSLQYPEVEAILGDHSVSPKQRIINLYEFKIQQLKEELDCKMGCMACNITNEMAEHSENIRKVIAEKGSLIRSQVTEVVKEAQRLGEIDSNIDAKTLVEFIEDAGKGAMISMKERQSSEPIDNMFEIIKTHFLK